jgi:hypothetical protein
VYPVSLLNVDRNVEKYFVEKYFAHIPPTVYPTNCPGPLPTKSQYITRIHPKTLFEIWLNA